MCITSLNPSNDPVSWLCLLPFSYEETKPGVVKFQVLARAVSQRSAPFILRAPCESIQQPTAGIMVEGTGNSVCVHLKMASRMSGLGGIFYS